MSGRNVICCTVIGTLLSFGIAGGALLYLCPPEKSDFYPHCLFYRLTGWKCACCGTLRAFHSVSHGRFAEGFLYNPLLFIAMPFLILCVFCPRVVIRPITPLIAAVVLAGYIVIRNWFHF